MRKSKLLLTTGLISGLLASASSMNELFSLVAGPGPCNNRSKKGAYYGKGQKKANKRNRWS